MASVSVSHMILFIASMLIAASVAGVFTSSVDRLSGAIDDQGLQISENIRTDIEIISDAGACVFNCSGQNNLTLLVKNTGTDDLVGQSDQIDVLIDGQYQVPSGVAVEVLGSDGPTWPQGSVARINVTAPDLGSGDHRAKVVANGDEEVFEFRIP